MTKSEWLKAIETAAEELASTYYPYEKVYIMPQSLLDQMLYQTYNSIPIEWLKKCTDRYILCCTIIDDIIEEWREQNG